MNKTPKIEWGAGTKTRDDIQVSYIAKAIYYSDDYGISLFVGRKTDETKPTLFSYCFAIDIDPTEKITIGFQKRGRYWGWLSCTIAPEHVEGNHCALILPETITVPCPQTNSTCTLNIFEEHIKSDAVVFSYTAKDGTQKEFRFSLAGFCEHYLEQFI